MQQLSTDGRKRSSSRSLLQIWELKLNQLGFISKQKGKRMALGKTKLEEFARKVKALRRSQNQLWLRAANREQIKKLIIKLNTEIQLGQQNVDSRGIKLSEIGGNYSPVTLELSKLKGRPKLGESRIDLHDTGEFYRSWRVTVNSKGILIEADPIKDGENLEDDWGDKIIGLTNDNINIVSKKIAENYKAEVTKALRL